MVLHVEGLRFERSLGSGDAGGDAGFAIEVDALELRAGEVLGLVGPSGCGKSTLIDVFALLRAPSRISRFTLLTHDVAALWRARDVDVCTALRGAHIGIVLQTGGLLPSLRLRDNVAMSQRLLGRDDHAWVDELLARLGLEALAERLPAQLSIGQRQRAAIARALAHRPALVLADEPTASLGVEHAPAALDLLVSLARSSGAALVVVSHDVALLRSRGVPLRRCVPAGGVVRLAPADEVTA